MFQHIALLKLKPGVTEEQVERAFAAGASLPNEIAGVQRLIFGVDRSHPEHGFEVASIVQLDSEDALQSYLAHPARRRYLAEHVDPLTEERIEIDVPVDGSHQPSISAAGWYWGTTVRDLD
jgi:hypothetical protein